MAQERLFLRTTLAGLLGRFGASDETLMRSLQAGAGREAFGRLIERWAGPIRGLCYRMLGNAATAEDLTQETFARVYGSRHRFKPDAPFSTYIRRIALNLCYDELRRRRRSPTVDLDDLAPFDEIALQTLDEASPDWCASRMEEGELVRQALEALAPIYRTVIVLRHYEGLKIREIAVLLEVPEGTVNSRLAEALVRLQRHLKGKLREPADGAEKKSLRSASSQRKNSYATSKS